MENMKKQSTFSQTLYNAAKKGAYYTDLEHCRALSKLFDFSQATEVCVLEPSIGDGSAVSAIVDKANNPHVKIFGVELDQEQAKINSSNSNIDFSINADFTNGVEITNNAFSFCFGNPPYGDSLTSLDRLEKAFLKKVIKYLKKNAMLVWVIPYYVFLEDESYARILTNNFKVLKIFKFHQSEFEKWQQVVVIARKKSTNYSEPGEVDKVMKEVENIETMDLVPFDFQGSKKKIVTSKEQDIRLFTSTEFDYMKAYKNLDKSSLYEVLIKDVRPKDALLEIGNPPTALKTDHLYLLSVSGYSEGIMGDEEKGDCHLQRGKVEIKKSVTSELGDDEKSIVETTRTYAKTMLTVIQNNGEIKVLE